MDPRGDHAGPGDVTGEERHATLRRAAASLTATARRAESGRRGGHAGEDAR
ncbi:DUF6380 family protein [Streptomyces sp. NPDC101213]|uniref:DUF6380 family protein n=1 Tax=unclassified Streptomyces TaxID=2593676 RepID=UPI00370106A9